MSTITNPTQNTRTIYIGAVVALVFIATIGAILRLMFLRRMRRRLNASIVTTVVPPYPQSPNYPGYQPPYVPSPAHPYPGQRPRSGPFYPDYPNPYPRPYNPPSPSPRPSRPIDVTPKAKPRRQPPNDQDGRATRNSTGPADSTIRRMDGRNTVPENNTTPGDDLGPPPAYAYDLDGRDS